MVKEQVRLKALLLAFCLNAGERRAEWVQNRVGDEALDADRIPRPCAMIDLIVGELRSVQMDV